MVVSFCEPSHNYNICLTREEFKILQEKGHITVGYPTTNKLPTKHYIADEHGTTKTESSGHYLTFNDSPCVNPDADRTVQFLTINVYKEEQS